MSYSYPYQRPTARDTTPNFESPLDAALRLSSQEKRPNYPTSDRRGSCNDSSYRPRGTDETRPMNLFGRTFKETLSDFPKVVRSQTSRRDQRTPSLISDDSPSTSSSTSYTLSPFQGNYRCPPTSSMSMRSSPASDYENGDEVGPHHRLPFVLPDDRSSGSSSYSPSVASDEYESHLGRRPSVPLKNHNAVGTYNLPKTHSKSRHVKAPAIKTIEDELEEQIDELWNDDDYMPEPQVLSPPSPSKGVLKRGPKVAGRFVCDQCGKSFTRNFDKGRHMKTIHGEASMDDILSRSCPCGAVFSRSDACQRHIRAFTECEALVRQNKTPRRTGTFGNSSRSTRTARV